MHKEGEHTVESAVEARGGFLGRPVLIVLVVSVALACVAMALSYAGFFRNDLSLRDLTDGCTPQVEEASLTRGLFRRNQQRGKPGTFPSRLRSGRMPAQSRPPWTEHEDELLTSLVERGHSVTTIATRLDGPEMQ